MKNGVLFFMFANTGVICQNGKHILWGNTQRLENWSMKLSTRHCRD